MGTPIVLLVLYSPSTRRPSGERGRTLCDDEACCVAHRTTAIHCPRWQILALSVMPLSCQRIFRGRVDSTVHGRLQGVATQRLSPSLDRGRARDVQAMWWSREAKKQAGQYVAVPLAVQCGVGYLALISRAAKLAIPRDSRDFDPRGDWDASAGTRMPYRLPRHSETRINNAQSSTLAQGAGEVRTIRAALTIALGFF